MTTRTTRSEPVLNPFCTGSVNPFSRSYVVGRERERVVWPGSGSPERDGFKPESRSGHRGARGAVSTSGSFEGRAPLGSRETSHPSADGDLLGAAGRVLRARAPERLALPDRLHAPAEAVLARRAPPAGRRLRLAGAAVGVGHAADRNAESCRWTAPAFGLAGRELARSTSTRHHHDQQADALHPSTVDRTRTAFTARGA